MSFWDRKQFGEPQTFMESVRWLLTETDNPIVAAFVLGVPLLVLVSLGFIGYDTYKALKRR